MVGIIIHDGEGEVKCRNKALMGIHILSGEEQERFLPNILFSRGRVDQASQSHRRAWLLFKPAAPPEVSLSGTGKSAGCVVPG